MKKYMLVGFAAAILAGCSSNESKTETFMGVECENIATGELGDYVLKCPIAQELEAVQAQEANAMFISGRDNYYHGFNVFEADVEHIYVNVVPNDCGDNTVGYRVMVKEPVFDGETMYAVAHCVQE